jgi:hypothetical protein
MVLGKGIIKNQKESDNNYLIKGNGEKVMKSPS